MVNIAGLHKSVYTDIHDKSNNIISQNSMGKSLEDLADNPIDNLKTEPVSGKITDYIPNLMNNKSPMV